MSPAPRTPTQAALADAISRAAGWLAAQPDLPELEARAPAGPAVACPALPYAAAAAAWLTRRTAALAPPDPRVATWLEAACDPDGWVRFFGPGHPELIGPDLDDTALVWSERRALLGDLPPEPLLAAVRACRHPDGAFDTWPSPPHDGPPTDTDAVVHVNVLAWLAALGDAPPDPWLAARLAAPPAPTSWYPDPATLAAFARRAADLGLPHPPPPPESPVTASLLAACAHAAPGLPHAAAATAALLALQRPDGAFPWAPIFVGGPRTGFPDGRTLDRPAFGGPILSTALAVDALARMAALPALTPPPARASRAAAAAAPPAWTAACGPLSADHALAVRDLASAPHPVLTGPDGDLPLDLAPATPGLPAFCTAGPWAISYRGSRSPTPGEARALRALADRLASRLPAGPAPAPPPPSESLDLASRIATAPAGPAPLHLTLAAAAAAPDRLPATAAALATARARGLTLRLAGLAHCALPADDAWLAPSPPERPPALACHRCVRAPRCPGPGPHALRPRTSDTPWLPLDRLAAAWHAAHATPPPDLWRPFARALHDLGRGPTLGDTLWSPTLAVDVSAGRLSPTFRLAAFYGRRDGTRAPGAPLIAALPALAAGTHTDAPALARALAPAAQHLPAYPGLQVDPAHAALSVYLDTDHLPAAAAAAEALALAARLGLPLSLPEPPPRLLGLSAHLAQDGRASLDLYAHLTPTSPAAWAPPPGSPAAMAPAAIATLTVTSDAPLAPRKWDHAFWPHAADDDAVLAALGLADSPDATSLRALLASPEFTLHPTTLGSRPDGRRLYLRVC